MTGLRLRPDLRAPWQAIAGFAVLLYVIESALRGWDFVPTTMDLIIFGTLTAILVLRIVARRLLGTNDENE